MLGDYLAKHSIQFDDFNNLFNRHDKSGLAFNTRGICVATSLKGRKCDPPNLESLVYRVKLPMYRQAPLDVTLECMFDA